MLGREATRTTERVPVVLPTLDMTVEKETQSVATVAVPPSARRADRVSMTEEASVTDMAPEAAELAGEKMPSWPLRIQGSVPMPRADPELAERLCVGKIRTCCTPQEKLARKVETPSPCFKTIPVAASHLVAGAAVSTDPRPALQLGVPVAELASTGWVAIVTLTLAVRGATLGANSLDTNISKS